ncbi:MAG: hypothetical protein Q4D51_10170 [Eubacteriales bacterium]|nr:hypothetical protein [Eubacteriales bacterium]
MIQKYKKILVTFLLAAMLVVVNGITSHAAIPIGNTNITIAKHTYTYTGKAIKPGVTVSYHNKKLVKNQDYKVSYKNNKKVGTATITQVKPQQSS